MEEVDRRKFENYVSQNQDVVEQLIVGLGWRVVAANESKDTKSVVVRANSENGATFVVSSPSTTDSLKKESSFVSSGRIQEFKENQGGRQGIAVLAFDVSPRNQNEDFDANLLKIKENYEKFHPYLLGGDIISNDFQNGTKMKFFEAFAYEKDENKADRGTKLRFVARSVHGLQQTQEFVFPELSFEKHEFNETSMNLIFDHWVSNVINREQFLKILANVLGFTPKVDFNAGVVAAGKAKIESTVTGNDVEAGIEDESFNAQVYLPINNALSEFGHVHLFLKEIGQGVQHIASKSQNLVQVMERINFFRRVTGRGFKSLRIPRVYYGVLEVKRHLKPILAGKATKCFNFLVNSGVVSSTGVVELDLSKEKLEKIVDEFLSNEKISLEKKDEVAEAVLKARYINLYNMAGDSISESEYLAIVRNKILLDKQGYDFLLQIFTANILQEKVGDESPFLEFIERKCGTFVMEETTEGKRSKLVKKVRPGCGGFGIRNFLTLFLSIEVSKAMDELQSLQIEKESLESKTKEGINERIGIVKKKIQLFTAQLDESNPILNEISDLMTKEAEVIEEIKKLTKSKENSDRLNALKVQAGILSEQKESENKKLQDLSQKFSGLFSKLD